NKTGIIDANSSWGIFCQYPDLVTGDRVTVAWVDSGPYPGTTPGTTSYTVYCLRVTFHWSAPDNRKFWTWDPENDIESFTIDNINDDGEGWGVDGEPPFQAPPKYMYRFSR